MLSPRQPGFTGLVRAINSTYTVTWVAATFERSHRSWYHIGGIRGDKDNEGGEENSEAHGELVLLVIRTDLYR